MLCPRANRAIHIHAEEGRAFVGRKIPRSAILANALPLRLSRMGGIGGLAGRAGRVEAQIIIYQTYLTPVGNAKIATQPTNLEKFANLTNHSPNFVARRCSLFMLYYSRASRHSLPIQESFT